MGKPSVDISTSGAAVEQGCGPALMQLRLLHTSIRSNISPAKNRNKVMDSKPQLGEAITTHLYWKRNESGDVAQVHTVVLNMKGEVRH